jgi:PadR family transcriptional regulator PadR
MAGQPGRQDARSLVLGMLARGEAYGYQVAAEMRRINAEATLGEGAVYPVLRGLEGAGLASGHWVDVGTDVPRRRYYVVTPKGLAVLERQAAAQTAPRRRRLGEVRS